MAKGQSVPESTSNRNPTINLFSVSLIFCIIIATIGIGWPETFATAMSTFTNTTFDALGWFFVLSVSGMLVLSLWMAFGPYGHLKLGKPQDKPEFSTLSWLSMLFAAGMGVGLIFWSVAEPVIHFNTPPTGAPPSAETARQSLVITNLHWGLHAWAVYCTGALVLAYFHFRKNEPYLAGAPIRASFKGRWVEPIARLADLLAVISVAFGVAGSMAMGIFQIHTGLHLVLGIPAQSIWVSGLLMALLFVCYMLSAATSLDKGIQILSNLNMALAIALMLFVLLFGPTEFLLSTTFNSLGDYLTALPNLSLRMYPFSELGGWFKGWTLMYFIWWIAWAPFVGIFIARISRGRTIREFVLGVLLAPTSFTIIWFAIFGGTGIHQELYGDANLAALVNEDVTLALFALFESLPGSAILSGLSLTLVFVFLITSVDSATFVLGMLTSKGSMDPPTSRKLGWGVTLAVLGTALMVSGNIDVVRAAAISGAVPFTLILMLQGAALIRTLRADRRRAQPKPHEEVQP